MFLFIIGAIIISFSPICVKAIAGLGPTTIGLYRCLFATIGLLPFFMNHYRKGHGVKSGKEVPYLLLSGLFFSLDLFSWNKSVVFIGAGLGTILCNTQAIYMALIGIFLSKEKVTNLFLISLPMALLGILLIADFRGEHQLNANYHEGVFFGLLTAIFYCGYVLFLRKAGSVKTSTLTPTQQMFYISLFTGFFLMIFSFIENGQIEAINSFQNLVLLVMFGILVHTIGWMCLTKALPHVSISLSGLMLLIQPVLATVWGMLIFGEELTTLQSIGAVLTLLAIYFGSGSAKYLFRKILKTMSRGPVKKREILL